MSCSPILEQTLRDIAQQQRTVLPHPTLLRAVQQLPCPVHEELEFLATCYQQAKTLPDIDANDLKALAIQILERLGAAAAAHGTPTCAATTLQLTDYLPWFVVLTHLSQPHLGSALVRNYWLLSRPSDPWLKTIPVETFFQEQVAHRHANRYLSNQQQNLLENWLEAFVGYCSRVLPALPSESISRWPAIIALNKIRRTLQAPTKKRRP